MTTILILLLLSVPLCYFIFIGGGVSRSVAENFYGHYFAEDGVISEDIKPNSKQAIEACVQAGIGIKASLHATGDRRAVISTYANLAKEYGLDKNISECDTEELEALGIISLPELIRIVDGRVAIILQLTPGDNNETLCRYTADIINTSGLKNIGVASFQNGMITWFKQKEKAIFRGLVSAPAKDFVSLPKLDRFLTGNLLYNYFARPNFILYRNKPLSPLVKLAYFIGQIKGTWTITTAEEGKVQEEDKDIIICRGFVPENIHFKNIPETQKTVAEKQLEEKAAKTSKRAPRSTKITRYDEDENFAEKAEDFIEDVIDVVSDVAEDVKESVEDVFEKIIED